MSGPRVLPTMSRCPQTGVTIPECSCRHCHVEQLHRYAPELLPPVPAFQLRRLGGLATISIHRSSPSRTMRDFAGFR